MALMWVAPSSEKKLFIVKARGKLLTLFSSDSYFVIEQKHSLLNLPRLGRLIIYKAEGHVYGVHVFVISLVGLNASHYNIFS